MTEPKSREFNKRVISMADGRRLIYYDFEPQNPKPSTVTTIIEPVQGKER